MNKNIFHLSHFLNSSDQTIPGKRCSLRLQLFSDGVTHNFGPVDLGSEKGDKAARLDAG